MRGFAKFALSCLSVGQKRRERRNFQAAEVLEARALLTAFVVTNLAASGAGSLQQAVMDSNAQYYPDDNGDTITFQSGLTGSIPVNQTLNIESNVTIIGPGADVITIDAKAGERLMWIGEHSTTVIEGLTFTNDCDVFGGEITVIGDLTIRNSVFDGLQAVYSHSVISNSGVMQIESSQFMNMGNNPCHLVAEYAPISSIGHNGVMKILDSEFSGNIANGTDNRGLIHNNAELFIGRSTFTDNQANDAIEESAAEIYNVGTLFIEDTEFEGFGSVGGNEYTSIINQAKPQHNGIAVIVGSTFSGYQVGIKNINGGTLAIGDSLLKHNYTGIYNAASAHINSTLLRNNLQAGIFTEAGGAASGTDPVETQIVNSTFSGNDNAITSKNSGMKPVTTATHITVTDGFYGITLIDADITLNNSIVAGNLFEIGRNGISEVVAHHSLIGDASSSGEVVNGTNGNIVGVLASERED